ncbi:MAG: M61 family metallopeptidase [Deltaproteobacteria bacterium]|nr:M61 family metallopeptidase [Deltaproteobacteria bacterium]
MSVRHKVALTDPHGHLLTVTSTFTAEPGATLPDPLIVAMPVWTPGSYLVREYSRCVEGLRASAASSELTASKLRKNAWSIAHGGASEVTVGYELYCNDLSVRTNHVDASHVFINGAATFMFASHAPSEGAEVHLDLPEEWKVGSALPRAGTNPRVLVARDFDHLVDSPIHVGHVERTFEVLGKRHTFAIWGDAPNANWDEIARDTKAIIETEAAMLGGLPYDDYTFIWLMSPRARGGLEHESSTALTMPPSAFDDRRGYLDAMSLVAHEVLHLWNIKRIRPEGLTPYRYEVENYTKTLWWFEGATSYFDWRILRMAGLCSVDEYLDHLGEEIGRLEDTPGRMLQSAAEASFDAWIKLYRADENTVNSTVSYYLKGEIVCALLDVELRTRTGGQRGLDHVLDELWRAYGRESRPVPEDGFAAVFERVAGSSMRDVLDPWVEGRRELPIDAVFAKIGLALRRDTGRRRGALGVRLRSGDGRAIVASVLRGRPAHRAGIDAGDEIVAIGDRRVEGGKLDSAMAGRLPDTTVDVEVARDGVMRKMSVTLDAPPADRVRITLAEGATPAQRTLLQGWLRGLPNR